MQKNVKWKHKMGTPSLLTLSKKEKKSSLINFYDEGILKFSIKYINIKSIRKRNMSGF